jgi:hypothetical protein
MPLPRDFKGSEEFFEDPRVTEMGGCTDYEDEFEPGDRIEFNPPVIITAKGIGARALHDAVAELV